MPTRTTVAMEMVRQAACAVGGDPDGLACPRRGSRRLEMLRSVGPAIMAGDLDGHKANVLVRALGGKPSDVSEVQIVAAVQAIRMAWASKKDRQPGSPTRSDGCRVSNWTAIRTSKRGRVRSQAKAAKERRRILERIADRTWDGKHA